MSPIQQKMEREVQDEEMEEAAAVEDGVLGEVVVEEQEEDGKAPSTLAASNKKTGYLTKSAINSC